MTNSVAQLGIVGVDVNDDTAALLTGLRISSGVLVAAREQALQDAENPLTTGDVIHSVNGFNVRSLDGLRTILDGLKARSRVVVQVEREGRLLFVTVRLS